MLPYLYPLVPSSWIMLKKMKETKLHHSNVKVKAKLLSRVRLFVTLWTEAHHTPPSMGFSRQEYWSGLPFPSPGDLPEPGMEPKSLELQMLYPLSHQGSPFERIHIQLIETAVTKQDPMGPSSDRHPAPHPHPASCL